MVARLGGEAGKPLDSPSAPNTTAPPPTRAWASGRNTRVSCSEIMRLPMPARPSTAASPSVRLSRKARTGPGSQTAAATAGSRPSARSGSVVHTAGPATADAACSSTTA